MIEVVEIKMRDHGKRVFYNPRGLDLHFKEQVIVEADRGVDYGLVMSEIRTLSEADVRTDLRSVIRTTTESDQEKIMQLRERSKQAIFSCRDVLKKHPLGMKIVDAEYSFDSSRLTFYFTADGRVDFRALVKDLAAVFKVRIELRQIGVRDEARMVGGVGACGRSLCCSTFLKEFHPVSVKMARVQNLSSNPSKISGVCGRLMCCLSYENDVYQKLKKGLPKAGDHFQFDEIKAKVIDVNVLKQSVLLLYEEKGEKKREWISLEGRLQKR